MNSSGQEMAKVTDSAAWTVSFKPSILGHHRGRSNPAIEGIRREDKSDGRTWSNKSTTFSFQE